ncbi:MAG: bifunctional DNA primase/polymerase, partial [Acidimicrobiia bacterium]|nr:bifunctional DNA primase/polymerase [Acidimicrobiia bacterium]
LEALEHSHGPLPATLTARTGRGAHHVYRLPAGAVIGCSTGRLGEGIDIRGDGGYVIAAPSVHPSGTVYRWDDPALEVAPLPVWVSTLLGQRPERLEPDPDPDDDSDDSDDPEHPELDLVADTYARTGDLEAALDAGRELIDAGVATAEQVAATLALVQIRATQLDYQSCSRRSLRRSSAVVPAHTPAVSVSSRANRRHSRFTRQRRHTSR